MMKHSNNMSFDKEWLVNVIEQTVNNTLGRKRNIDPKFAHYRYIPEDDLMWAHDEHSIRLLNECPNTYDWYLDDDDDFKCNNSNRTKSFVRKTNSQKAHNVRHNVLSTRHSEWFNDDYVINHPNASKSKSHESKWNSRLIFSGLNVNERMSANDVECFLRNIQDEMQTEGISPSEMLAKIPQYLFGPAINWYTITKRFIHSWHRFEYEFRNRFSNPQKFEVDSIDISVLFSEPHSIESKIPCEQNEIESPDISDNQQSLSASIMETLSPIPQDDSLNYQSEKENLMESDPLLCRRSCKDSLKLQGNIGIESRKLISQCMIQFCEFKYFIPNAMSKSIMSYQRKNDYDPVHAHRMNEKYWNYKKRKKKMCAMMQVVNTQQFASLSEII